jgi:pyroglutamyl-peptidase
MRRRRFAGHSLRYMRLPVDWEKAPRLLHSALQRFRPDAIFCLGEGKPDRVAWECCAQNACHGTDETGKGRLEEKISSAGPLALFSEKRPPSGLANIVISEDAGQFLCNRVLWEALSHSAQAVFLHFPPQGPSSSRAYNARWLPILQKCLFS